MTSAGSGDRRHESETPEPITSPALVTPTEPVAPTRRSPAVRVAAAIAILVILAALWILTWAVVSGALTSDDGPFRDDPARNGTVSGAPVSTVPVR